MEPARMETTLDDGVLLVTISNPSRANALTDAMLSELAGLLDGPAATDARAVVLTGAGDRHFSAGADLGVAPGEHPGPALRESERRVRRAADAIRALPIPAIAALNGAAYGGGLEIAMACDWRVASATARLAMPPARLGVAYTPEGLGLFVAAVGPAATAQLFLTGEALDAGEAHRIGLVNAVVAAEQLLPHALAQAHSIAANAPLAVGGTVAALRALSAPALSPEARAGVEAWRERAFASDDLAEGVAAFRGRRAARFIGR